MVWASAPALLVTMEISVTRVQMATTVKAAYALVWEGVVWLGGCGLEHSLLQTPSEFFCYSSGPQPVIRHVRRVEEVPAVNVGSVQVATSWMMLECV